MKAFVAALVLGTATCPQSLSAMGAMYPLHSVNAEFVEACGSLQDYALTQQRLLAAGWARSLPVSTSSIGKLMKFQEGQARQLLVAEGAGPSKPLTYRKTAHGRVLDLMLQSVSIEGGFLNGCRLYDFDVGEAPAREAILKLRNEAPSKDKTEEGLVIVEWAGTGDIGKGDVQIVYIPRGHLVEQAVGASGLSFKTTFIGIEQE